MHHCYYNKAVMRIKSEEIAIVVLILSLEQDDATLHILSLDLETALLHQFQHLRTAADLADVLLSIMLNNQVILRVILEELHEAQLLHPHEVLLRKTELVLHLSLIHI